MHHVTKSVAMAAKVQTSNEAYSPLIMSAKQHHLNPHGC